MGSVRTVQQHVVEQDFQVELPGAVHRNSSLSPGHRAKAAVISSEATRTFVLGHALSEMGVQGSWEIIDINSEGCLDI